MDPMQFWNLLQIYLKAPDTNFGTGVLGPLEPLLITYMGKTPVELTVENHVVMGLWGTMLAIADAFFLLLIVLGVIHMMISNSTGSLSIPISQFLPKVIVTGLLMNLSFFLGQDLLAFNNLLCQEVNVNLNGFFNTINGGDRVNNGQSFLLYLALLVLLNIGLFRLLFQVFERLALWNLLFVLGPIAFLCSLLPLTSPMFSFWGRMFVIVTFTQFVQFLALALALALIASAGQHGLMGYFMAVAMVFLVGKIPGLLARFPSMGSSNTQGIGHLISTTILAARLLAA